MPDSNPTFPDTSRAVEPERPASRKSPLRRVVPLALFVLIIGGIAWLVQNMPTWRTPQIDAPVARGGPDALLAFMHRPNERGMHAAVWDKDSPTYAREFERGAEGPLTEGRYYFPLFVHPDMEVQFGLSNQSCDCAKLHVAVISEAESKALVASIMDDPGKEIVESSAWTWQALQKADERGVTLPAGSRAVVRMSWHNRRGASEQLNLNAQFWAKHGVQRQAFAIYVPAVSASPLRVLSERADVGLVRPEGHGKAQFVLWSPTRQEGKLVLTESPSPLLEIRTEQLDPAACAALQKKLRGDQISTRVGCAWHVHVTVHEHKDKHWNDQGHFVRILGVKLDGEIEDGPTLMITGAIRSELTIGGGDDQGKINLGSFETKNGTRKSVLVLADPKTGLQLESKHPAALDVTLESGKLSPKGKREWTLKVVVPANQFFGTITDDSAVILKTDSTPPRQIRIPLTGHAKQG